MRVKCAYCGQVVEIPGQWGYKAYQNGRVRFFCRYNHMRQWQQRRQLTDSKQKQVQCLETGEVYPSTAVAGEQLDVDAREIARACRTGGSSAGLHWAYTGAKNA